MKKISLLPILFFSFLIARAQAPVDFYITTGTGSQYNLGAIVKTDGQGNNHQIKPFTKYKERASVYANPIEPVTGILYGMTSLGGDNDHGVIWEYNISTEAYRIKHSFDSVNGKNPNGSLVLASNGKLYGMTKNGGVYDKGVIFEYDLATQNVQKLFDFGSANGEEPKGSLIQATDGKLYGMTSSGGANAKGVIFNYDLSTGIFTKLMDFDGTNNGATPQADLFQASNGLMYAFTMYGGASNYGVMFSFDPVSSTYSKILDLVYASRTPIGSFIQSSTDGKLYGLTKNRLIKYTLATSAIETITSSFTLDGTPVQNAYGEIMFYSRTATTGNMYVNGAIAKYSTNIQAVAYFASGIGQTNDGCGTMPCNGLLLASNNRLYGITGQDSDYHGGALFSYQGYGTQIRPEIRFSVQSLVGSSTSNLVQVDRKLYGIGSGGKYNDGTIYRYDIDTDSIEVMVDMDIWNMNSGMNSIEKSFVLHPNGKLYTTYNNGNSLELFLLEYVPGATTYTNVYNFPVNTNTMVSTTAELIVGDDGLIYGVSDFGGANTYGTLFSFDVTTGTYTLLHSFSSYDGFPYKHAVVQASNGKLYGITPGDVNGADGYIYSFDPATNTFEEIYTLNAFSYAMGSFVEGPGGNLYASFRYGGQNYDGAIISLNPVNNAIQTAFSFEENVTGFYPKAVFMGTNGKLYGFSDSYSLRFFAVDPLTTQHELVYNFNINTELNCGNFYGYTSVCHDIFVTSTVDSIDVCPFSTFNYTSTATGDSLAFQWVKDTTLLSGQTGITLSLANFSPSDTGAYYCIVSNGCREVISDSLYLTILPQPVINAGTDQHICNDSLTTLTASGTGVSYAWSGGITDGTAFSVTENATYVVTGTDSLGCTNTDTVTVAITPVVHAGSDTTVCYLTPATFYGSGDAVSYVWNDTINDGGSIIIDATQQVVVRGFNAAGCSYTDTLTVFMDTCQIVWPGDSDNNAEVDLNDFFNIGLNYGQTGLPRNTISTLWEALPAPIWDSIMSTGTGAGLNMAYADCNGDGTVDVSDTVAVYDNFGQLHAKPVQQEEQNLDEEASIYFNSSATAYGANQLVTIDILAGTAALPLEDIYGLGFKVGYTATGIVSGSLQIRMNDANWLGTVNSNAIRLGVPSNDDSHFSLAFSRTDHSNVTGYGIIGRVSFLTSNLNGAVNLTVTNAVSIDSAGIQSDLVAEDYMVTIDPMLSVSDLTETLNWTVYPNPSNGAFSISGLQPEFNYSIELYDMTGKKVQKALKVSNQTSVQVNTNLPSGSYLIEISTGNAISRKQVSFVGH
ncbi:choice-of-anchor tandem repeat GloVer-containing protein [Fluviicola sp.]|uniref:choice-of-anchor tandem repeat GloVer-containing protein n=1 Tax=Fluviicola sp. TaxID=1917219 RepID=UPI0031DACDE0